MHVCVPRGNEQGPVRSEAASPGEEKSEKDACASVWRRVNGRRARQREARWTTARRRTNSSYGL